MTDTDDIAEAQRDRPARVSIWLNSSNPNARPCFNVTVTSEATDDDVERARTLALQNFQLLRDTLRP